MSLVTSATKVAGPEMSMILKWFISFIEFEGKGISCAIDMLNIPILPFGHIFCRHLSGEVPNVNVFVLQNPGKGSADSIGACQKLKVDLQAAFNVLPKDLQQLLLSNPKRAVLLQGSQEKAPGANGIGTQTSL